MKFNTIEYLKKIFARLTESRVFNLRCKPGIKVTLLRWATVVTYGVLAGLFVHLFFVQLVQILPAWFFSFNFAPSLSVALHIAYGFIAALSVIHIQDRYYLRFRRINSCIHIGATLLYPTLHFSVLFGLLTLLAIVSSTPELNVSLAQSPFIIFTGAFVAAYFGIQVIRNEKLNSERAKKEVHKETKIIDLLTCDDKTFEDWIMKDKSETRLDFFDRSPYVDRIKEHLKSSDAGKRGQVLLGEFGSGKTSIINYVKSSLDQEKWIVSEFDSWQRASKPEDLVRLLMEQVIHDVGQVIEATSIENIPDAFVDALYGTHHWFKVVSGLLKSKQPEDVLSRLDGLLKIHNKKLLIVIENIDRNEHPEHLVNTIAGMLDKLSFKGSDGESTNSNINFIFSGDKDKIPLETVYRISDCKEHVETTISTEVILRFMNLCIKKCLDNNGNGSNLIIPYLSKGFTITGESLEDINNLQRELDLDAYPADSMNKRMGHELDGYQTLVAATDVISNPRRLKYALRYAYDLWCSDSAKLAGEVHIFDLVIYAIAEHDGELMERIKQFSAMDLSGESGHPYMLEAQEKKNKLIRDSLDSKQPKKTQGNANLELTINSDKYVLENVASEGGNKLNPFSSSSRDKLAYYLMNGQGGVRGQLIRRTCQPIILEGGIDADIYKKYRQAIRAGIAISCELSDQFFLKFVDEIAQGNLRDLGLIMRDSSLDLSQCYIFDLLSAMLKNYWRELSPLLKFSKTVILHEEIDNSIKYDGLRGNLFEILFSAHDLLRGYSKGISDDAYFEFDEVNGRIYEMLEKNLSVLLNEGRYSDISAVLRLSVVNRNIEEFRAVGERLIKIYYSSDMASRWANSELKSRNNNALYNYFNIVTYLEKNKDTWRRIDSDLWLMVCESLLRVAYLSVNSGDTYSSFEHFFNGFGDDIRKCLYRRASQEGVKENLSIEALDVLNFLEENYSDKVDKSQ
ncbi:P-loop NTPase fold protein [Thalassolituus oleivorans]|uniref:P-loop NTPase fold protein n=1 Tax=Thalassolituus oleivorans TaxID=187493 RepID=UPI00240A2E13|nr:P-loop NTPase fold protein [Thalassolituus oleivorans]MDF1642451.1 P-loop NTPase fold protein [Thalassolituus oleivorans]